MNEPCIYIVANRSRTIYVGVTNNLQRRVYEHREGLVPGFTTRYNIKRLVYFEAFPTMLEAIAREAAERVATGEEGGADRDDESGVARHQRGLALCRLSVRRSFDFAQDDGMVGAE